MQALGTNVNVLYLKTMFETKDSLKIPLLLFLGMIGSGKSDIRTVVSIAQSQVEDGPVPPAIEAFASSGAWGAHSSNEERDLHSWLKDLHGITQEVYYTTLKIQAKVSKTLSCFQHICFYHSTQLPGFYHSTPWHPLQVMNSDEVQALAVPCLLPHEILHAVASAGQKQV